MSDPAAPRAELWRTRGAHFAWSPAGEDAAPVQVFHVELGDADAPVLSLVHGFPTCSIDWFDVAERLADRYRVCMMDFPGYGFSDKPRGWATACVATPSCSTTISPSWSVPRRP